MKFDVACLNYRYSKMERASKLPIIEAFFKVELNFKYQPSLRNHAEMVAILIFSHIFAKSIFLASTF